MDHCLKRAQDEFGLDGVELSWNNTFIRPSCTRTDLDVLRRLKGRIDLRLDAHIWADLAGLGPGRADRALLDWLDLCAETGVKGLIVHGGSYPDREEGIARTRRILGNVLEEFERAGVVLNVENHYAYDYRDCRELFSEPWEFEEIFSLDSPSLGLCFDTGHGHLTRNSEALLRQLAPWLRHVHLADNYGQEDDHCMFRTGTVAWDSIFDLLSDTGFDGSFCIEFPVRAETGPFRSCVAELRERF